MSTPNAWALIIGGSLMAFGYSGRKKGYEVSGDLAFAIGFLGIFISVFHTKLYSLLNKICVLLSIGTFMTETNTINPYFIVFTSSLFFLLVLSITFLSSIFIPVKKDSNSEKFLNNLSLKINHNLKLLQDFFDKLWDCLESAPMSIAQGFEKTQQVVINENQSHTKKVVVMRANLHSTDPPVWHRKQFDKPTSLDDLLSNEQQGVRQFYDKLEDITSMYEKLRSYRATNLISKRTSKLRTLIKKVLEQNNPLKTA